ncbi:hypothetical protein JZ751_026351 [Albula glossodonta]|uniref:Proline dehydrogenase n=1 Tax=Albula glossodonta TaxID=121402 RepID=A0A8T2PKE1_9TELE|nr:hypothetical protein JZ751_026351 [Albula glossodonta]
MSLFFRPSFHHFLSVRLLGTAAPRTLNGKHLESSSFQGGDACPVALSFEDPSAFRVKSFGELLRALGVFRLCSVPILVNNCGKLMSFARSLLGKRGFSLILRPTVYAQFVAGETEGEIAVAMEKMSSLGLRPMLAASVSKVRVLVDAEYTYMNPALSLVTMAMMKKFNQKGAWIWNTYQCYLKESRLLLLDAISQSVDQSFCLGVKLVRGAYMDKERKLAKQEGRPDPVHQSWEDTNDSYNGNLDIMLDLISLHPQCYRIIVATHNEESVRHAVSRMGGLGIDKHAGSVCFGQLLGMCDHVSLTLAQQGYSVYKSVPYGSVDDTVPYLVRRAQENRTVLQGIRKERDLLRQELRRRLREGLTGGRK